MKEVIGRYLMVCESVLRFPKEVNGTLIDIWCTALSGLEDQDIKYAFEHWIKNESEFPAPAEIRSIGRHQAYSRAQSAQVETEKPKPIMARLPADQKVTKDDIEEYRKTRISSGSRLHVWLERMRRSDDAE